MKLLDERWGEEDTEILVNKRERARRKLILDECVRQIIERLKALAPTNAIFYPDKNPLEFDLFTNGFAQLLKNSDLEFITEAFLKGVPESTKTALDKEGFTIKDLLTLPRLSDSAMSEHSVYIDILKYNPDEGFDWRLHVGSGTGQLSSWNAGKDICEKACRIRDTTKRFMWVDAPRT